LSRNLTRESPTTFDQILFGQQPPTLWKLFFATSRGGDGGDDPGLYESGRFEELFDDLLADTVDDETRKRLGCIHPTFMGGEYLPNYRRHEVEIARIELESTAVDVISLRARPAGSRGDKDWFDPVAPLHDCRRDTLAPPPWSFSLAS
jgi:hypothetical protein